jgi:hypothetical protein
MAFVVEDGTGLANATSYLSVADADAYHSDLGHADWVGLSTETEIRTLTVTAGCLVDGDLTITLNAVAFTVAVTNAAATADAVAAIIRATSFSGWTVSGSDAVAIFTATAPGTRAGAYSFAAAATGVAATLAQTQVGSDATKQAALIRATMAIDRVWYGRFRGTKLLATQALEWPREDAEDLDGHPLSGIPVYLERAAAEAALVELETPSALTPENSRGGAIKEENIAGAVKIVYQDWAASSTQYTAVNKAMAPLLTSSGGVLAVFRV